MCFINFTRRPGVYAPPDFCTLVIYSSHLTSDWQLLVCEELIHVMDGKYEKTKTPDELQGLIEKIIGPLSTEDFGLADLMAAKEKPAGLPGCGFDQTLPPRSLLYTGHVASSMYQCSGPTFYVWLMRHASWNETGQSRSPKRERTRASSR